MAVIKVQCPDCDASIRHTFDAADGPADVDITCPRCGKEFTSRAEAPPPQKSAKAKPAAAAPAKARRRDDEDDDGDEPQPRKKKKQKEAAGPNTKLIAGAVGGVLLLVGGVVAAIALGGKDKGKDTAKADPPAQVDPQPEPKRNPEPLPNPKQNPTPKQNPKQNPTPKDNPNPKQDPNPFPSPEPGPKFDPDDPFAGLKLPPPLPIRISGSAAPKGNPADVVVKPPPTPPLTPDEDPFERAKKFRVEGQPPKLPPLPPVGQRPLLTLDAGGHSAFVKNVFITPDGNRVVTVGEDKAVRVWDIRTGETVRLVRLPAGPGDEGALHAAALSPNGKTLAVGGMPLKTVKAGGVPIFFIDVERGTVTRSITNVYDDIRCMDYSADGKNLAVGCVTGNVQIYDTSTLNRLGGMTAHDAPVREVRYQPKGNLLATIGLDGVVRAWDAAKRTRKGQLDVSDLKPTTLDWTSDGRILAVGGASGDIKLFDGNNAQLLRTLKRKVVGGEPVQVIRMQFLPGDKEIAHCGVGGGPSLGWAGVVSAETGVARISFEGHTNTVMAINLSADGKRCVSSGGNQIETFVWSTEDGKAVTRLCGTGKGIWGVGWARDGKSIAWGTDNNHDADGNTPLAGVFRLDDFGVAPLVNAAAYQQGVKSDGQLRLQRVEERALAVVGPGGQARPLVVGDRIYSYSFLPGRGAVVVGGANSQMLFNAQTGAKIREFVGHTGHVLAVAPSPDGKYFVTGSSDQTIRVWVPDHEDPLLSIFVAGREWIAWTAGGFYTCSAQGEQLIAWQVNGGPYKAPAVHPAARFRPSLYQPALLKYLIPAGDMQRAMAMAKKFDKALFELRSVADVVPPEVTLPDLAEDGRVIDAASFTVKATATGKQPITALRLLVDGRPFQGAAGVKKFDKPATTVEASWDVPLDPGTHSFAVIADTPVSKGMSRIATLTRSGDPPKPNLYVLSVGVSEYAGDMKLRYAASDARLLARTFEKKSQGLYASVEARVLTDAQATKRNIQEGLDWLKSKMTPKDVGIVVFSGHGTRDPLGRFYLVPVDVSEADPAGTCLSGDEFKNRLENMPGRLVAILDACHSGAVADGGRRPARADGLVRDLVSEDAGVVVMCASLGSEYAIESPQTRAGFYTLGLVEGMRGNADIDKDGLVYINELDLYASVRVMQISGGMQTPTIGRPPTIRPFPIAKP